MVCLKSNNTRVKFMMREKYTAKDFAWTTWTANDIKKHQADHLADLVVAVGDIVSIPQKERTMENTLYALEDVTAVFMDFSGKIHMLMLVSPMESVRVAAQDSETTLSVESRKILRNRDLYAGLKYLVRTNKKLPPHKKRLLTDYITYYKRLGFDLDATGEKTLLANWDKLTVLAQKFSINITEDDSSLILEKKDLDGLSDAYIASLPEKDGKYTVTLDYPHLVPFLEQAHSATKRRALTALQQKKGGAKNMKLLAQIVAMREQNAALLGYATHADFKLYERMAKKGTTAKKFIHDLIGQTTVGAKKELAELAALKAASGSRKTAVIEPSDVAYYSNKLKAKKFSLDNDEVREYFPLEHVKSKVFALYGTLFSIRFVREKDATLWHPDAELYHIENTDGTVVASVLVDLHPRKGKYGHACAVDIVTGRKHAEDPNSFIAPIAGLVCNFPKATKNHPSLLSHDEVETYLHEFGHVLHHALSEAEFASQSGFHVAWDFVETPSQMVQNFAWEPSVLKKLTSHHKTGKPMSSRMIENLLASRKHMAAYGATRQCAFALYDLNLHMGEVDDLRLFYADLVAKYTGIILPKSQRVVAGFGHLMGYDAGYYSYMWAQVYAEDIYTVFADKGGVSATIGKKYRKQILAPGASRPEKESVKAFLGRTVSKKAFYKSLGL